MKKRKLHYVFHNPNTSERTADFLLDILIAANAEKVDRAIRERLAVCQAKRERIGESESQGLGFREEGYGGARHERA